LGATAHERGAEKGAEKMKSHDGNSMRRSKAMAIRTGIRREGDGRPNAPIDRWGQAVPPIATRNAGKRCSLHP
jgi:hypothetical protein